MTAPNPDRALMEIVHRAAVRALHQLDVERRRAYSDAPTDWHIDQATAVMDAVLPALVESGRLLPPSADSRIEWAVYWHDDDDDGIRYDELYFPSRAAAERRGPQMVGIHGITRFTLHQRTHREFKDGSMWVGPWRPVPSTPEETPDAQ